jgi:hypothetical protein
MIMIMHIIKCVPDQLGCKIYLIAILIIVHICLVVFVSCSHTTDVFSHLENNGVSIRRHLLFKDRKLKEEREVSNNNLYLLPI